MANTSHVQFPEEVPARERELGITPDPATEKLRDYNFCRWCDPPLSIAFLRPICCCVAYLAWQLPLCSHALALVCCHHPRATPCGRLAVHAGVTTIPPSAFFSKENKLESLASGYARFAFCKGDDVIKAAGQAVTDFLTKGKDAATPK